jgi:methionyl aminopeptidase
MEKEKIFLAGKIAHEVREWIRPQIKKGMLLIELAEKIECRIIELGGKPAFPANLSIDGLAAHYTPSHDSKETARGLMKVDFGVHIDGWIADNAFSIDLENSKENKKLIEVAEEALNKALETAKEGILVSEIGKAIQQEIEVCGFSPIINLCGHEMQKYHLHSGIQIPNINDKRKDSLKNGLYAVEPFATNGVGKVHEGKPSGIYSLSDDRKVRSPEARKILEFIAKEYRTLPFCSRWIVKKFGSRSLSALKQLEDNGNLHQYPQLVESSHAKVSQAEHTIFVDGKVSTTTS